MKEIQKKYHDAYYAQEYDANKTMSYISAAAGVMALIIWVLYLTKVFTIPDEFYLTVIIMFPCIAGLLLSPLLYVKTNFIKRPGYKYFILFSLLAAIILLNIFIPKHSLLFWPFAVLLANHYYNPKMGRIIYIFTLVAMLICIYLAMFFGEFDENLMGGGVVKPDGSIGTVDTVQERIELLNELKAQGNNRYIKVLVFYYFPRALTVSLFFMVSNTLNKRTYQLLDEEIKVHDAQEKAKTELNIAKNIQLDTLPSELVSTKDVEIIGELKAAKEVGGDLYDYIDIDEDHAAILIGDVSGKGVPAAMFMMKTISSFRDFATKDKTPSEILKQVNAAIFKGNKACLFVTCFLAILDKRDGKVVYANAGHNPPVVGSNGHYQYLKCSPGFILGCCKETYLQDEEFVLKPGESITLYTDGITEARNENGEFFGEERFLSVMNKHDYIGVVDVHHVIKDAIAAFVSDAPQSDDITFLTLKYKGDNYTSKEKSFLATKDNIPEMLSFIEDFGNEHQFPEEFTTQLVIVGDELFSNIIKYGYEDSNNGNIFVRLLFEESKNDFVLIIVDKAKAFNQLEVNNKEISGNEKKLTVGGLGLIIVKKIMDEYAYDRINDENILVLKKKFQ